MVTDLEVAKKLVQIEKSATDRGFRFNLTLKTIRILLNTKKCFFTGVVLNDIVQHDCQRTFDRIDNNLGYIEGNVVVCSRKLNMKKGNLSILEIKQLYLGLKKKKLI
jgi:hypothetical protein